MFLAYIDESGDTGPKGSKSYTLACVLVEDRRWLGALDELLGYRRYLKGAFGIPVRAEVKANFLLHNGGALRALSLSDGARFRIYRGFLRLQAKLELTTFAVVVRKEKLLPGADPRAAWERLLQRLERFSTKSGTPVMVIHDEGDAAPIRKWFRYARRRGSAGSRYGTGQLDRPALLLVDDPIPRASHESYFLQLADMNAFAAFRLIYPPPTAPKRPLVVTKHSWTELGAARLAAVSGTGPSGIVVC